MKKGNDSKLGYMLFDRYDLCFIQGETATNQIHTA